MTRPFCFTSLLQLLAILLIPAALTHTFGKLVDDLQAGGNMEGKESSFL